MQPQTNTLIRRFAAALVLATTLATAACHDTPTGIGSGPTVIIPGGGRPLPPGPVIDSVLRPMVVNAGALNVAVR
jgi:hypothetical protein